LKRTPARLLLQADAAAGGPPGPLTASLNGATVPPLPAASGPPQRFDDEYVRNGGDPGQAERHERPVGVPGQFTTADARSKLRQFYPTIQTG